MGCHSASYTHRYIRLALALARKVAAPCSDLDTLVIIRISTREQLWISRHSTIVGSKIDSAEENAFGRESRSERD